MPILYRRMKLARTLRRRAPVPGGPKRRPALGMPDEGLVTPNGNRTRIRSALDRSSILRGVHPTGARDAPQLGQPLGHGGTGIRTPKPRVRAENVANYDHTPTQCRRRSVEARGIEPRPRACKACVLPLSLYPHTAPPTFMGSPGLEPGTSCLSDRRANHLHLEPSGPVGNRTLVQDL